VKIRNEKILSEVPPVYYWIQYTDFNVNDDIVLFI
jgi:hypothetical protein